MNFDSFKVFGIYFSLHKTKGFLLLTLLGASSSLYAAVIPTTTSLSSSQNPSTYGRAVTFTATVSSRAGSPPNGDTVEFQQGATVLGTGALSGGMATLTISTLSAGTDNIKAKYLGDSSFGVSSSSPLAQGVVGAPTTTTVSSSQNPANVGQSVTFTATVTAQQGGTPTGNVAFYNGSSHLGTATLSGGVATLTKLYIQPTSESITAVYKGSSAFSTSTSNTIPETVGAGSYIDSTMTVDGITRYYEVFVPTALPAKPPMVFMLHGTRFSDSFDPQAVISLNWGWNTLANLNEFILVKPASTWDASTTQWNWNAYFMDAAFAGTDLGTCTEPPATGCPDDVGFLRQLIVNLSSQYDVNPRQIYVTGFSSGAQMAERVGVEISDLVAAIAPVSGQLVGENPPPPVLPGNAVAPISVQEWHGTDDQNLWPCGYGTTNYSGVIYTLDTVDDTFNYWTDQNSCSSLQTTAALCSGSSPNNANDAPSSVVAGDAGNVASSCSQSNVQVQFIWAPGVGHDPQTTTNEERWQFFVAHPKQASGKKF